ncbi:MAG: tRNA uridine-5-carboxymethylaminomethyl(34) synthesis GTPase MnmE [Mariprofundaceae bacterium]|nr:tRNA uridine-5-carboxymethylaminomethyl(34) synthesis GTPase MnmE [Mariprofundaceae bacterium]
MSNAITTIVAIATPMGRGGIGIIRLSGKQALSVAKTLSHKENFQARSPQLCTWKDAAGELIDSGLVLYFPAPASYTGEDVVELQGHGSPVLLHALLRRCIDLGCMMAEPGAFTRRAVENGCMDLSQAEAVIACIDATTERAGKQAQKHLAGDFGRKIESLMHSLTGVLAHVEACLDFPEEEIPELFLTQLRDRLDKKLCQPMQSMLAASTFGERLFSGASVAIVGAPNVGKSSVLNLLAGRNRAIVSDIPGTTRDILEVDFEVHGIPIRLIDTAGLRDSSDIIEQEGMRRAKQAASVADVVVFLADVLREDTWAYDGHYDIGVLNKCDLLEEPLHTTPENTLLLSAHTGEGLNNLLDALAKILGEKVTDGEDVFVTHERHRIAIQEAEKHIQIAMPMLLKEEMLDLAALELRSAWSALGEIIGIGDVEYILDRIFSEFCIGK